MLKKGEVHVLRRHKVEGRLRRAGQTLARLLGRIPRFQPAKIVQRERETRVLRSLCAYYRYKAQKFTFFKISDIWQILCRPSILTSPLQKIPLKISAKIIYRK